MTTPENRSEWTVPAQLSRHATSRPDSTTRPWDRVAHSVAGGEQLTFAAWGQRAGAVARGLLARGVRPGDRVVLACSGAQWTRYAVAWAGVLTAGAVAVPIAESSGSERLATAYLASGAVCGIGDSDAAVPGVPWYDVDTLAHGQSTGAFESPATPGSDAEIIYTSGTTGVPKGVVATHENLLHALLSARPNDAGTVALHALPPGTTVGQGLLVQPLGNRPHHTITLAKFTADSFLAAVEQYRPTDAVLVPAMAIALVNAAGAGAYDVSSVREVRTTSAPIHPATLAGLARLFPGARVRNVYSTTECWPRRLATDYDPARPKSLGRPARGSQVRIVDAAGTEVPAGTPGDVQLRGDAPQRRYDGEGAGSTVFLADGWTRTGDIGLVDPDGYFYLVDRNPDLINTGGLNVSSLDVEATLMDFPGVVEAAVCGVPHPVLTESVVAAVRLHPGTDLAALTTFVRDRQGPAAPQRITVVDDLPRNALGKVDKKVLRTQLAQTDGVFVAPATPTEEVLVDLWSLALDLDEVSVTADFLQLGGSSLSAMEIVAQVGDRLGKRLTVRDVLDTTSLRELAGRVDAAPAATDLAELEFPMIASVARESVAPY